MSRLSSKLLCRAIGLTALALVVGSPFAPVSTAQAPTLRRSTVELVGVSAIEQDRWALVIAVDRGRGSPGMDGSAADDARRLISVLTDQYGYRSDQIVSLIGGDANFKQILRSLQDLTQRIPRSASLLIYVSANGVKGPYGDAYALPRDGKVEEKWTLVPISDIAGFARHARSTLVVTDNCTIGASLAPGSSSGEPNRLSSGVTRALPQTQVQMQPQQQQQQQAPARVETPPAGEFDLVTLCPASEPQELLTRSLNLTEDPRRHPQLVQAFLQGIHGRAAGSDRSVSTQSIIDFLTRQGLELNKQVQFVSASNATPFRLTPQAESRLDGLRRLAMNQSAGAADRMEAVKSLSGLAAGVGGEEYRPQVGEVLRGVILDTSQPSDLRATALDELGRDGLSYDWGQEVAHFVLQGDSDSSLRVSALRAISRMGGDGAGDAIRSALTNDQSEVRAAAIELVVESRDPLAAPFLTALAHGDPSLSVRTSAITALPAVQGDPAETAAALIPLLNDRITFVRVQAMNSLVSAEAVSSAEAIASVLVDTEQQAYVRQTAAYALGKLVVPENRELVAERLVSVLGRNESGSIREAAVYSLGLVGPGDHESVLIDLTVEGGEDPEIRIAAAKALGTLRSTRAIEPLMRVVRDVGESSRLRISAIEAVGSIGDPVGAKMLYEVLEDKDAKIREAAAAAIGHARVDQDPETVLRLISFLSDPEYEVRESATRSLTDLTDQLSFEIMAERLNDKQSLTRRGIVDVFGRQALPRALALVIEASRDPSFDVRISAFEALARLQDLDPVGEDRRGRVMMAGFLDREPAVRRAAVTAVRTVIARLTFEGEIDHARQLAQEAVSRIGEDEEAAAWFSLLLLDGTGGDFPVEIGVDAYSAVKSSGPGWMSIQVDEGDELVTSYANTSGTEVLLTSFGLTVDDVNISFLQRWQPPGERTEFAGAARLVSNTHAAHLIMRTFAVPAGVVDAGRPDLTTPAQLHAFLQKLARTGLLQAADLTTVRVAPRPRDSYIQQSMKR
ncbi:MAG TPA: HEAT repeat domain-containing protein [Rhodothermia bacterium]